MSHYDIAVIGGGLAGLSLLYHFERAGKLAGKRVVLVDPERKSAHDRTWSFWEKGAGPFEDIVYHRWDRVTLHNSTRHCTCDLRPYAYKVILSHDFYARVNEVIDRQPAIERRFATAEVLGTDDMGVSFSVDGARHTATHAFSSRPHPLNHREVKQPYLDQHFRGWFVETDEETFDPGQATMMDFRTPQEGETRFLYVLPFTTRRALVEVAIFSNRHLGAGDYDRLIADYIRAHWTRGAYRIYHTEAGNIPMTTYPYPRRDGNLIYIGIGGGAARPSTGYTFYGLQRQLGEMARTWPEVGDLNTWPPRHLLYDATLLSILERDRLPGAEVFVNLFRKNPAPRVLAFLNGESSFGEEVALMTTAPLGAFATSFLGQVLR